MKNMKILFSLLLAATLFRATPCSAQTGEHKGSSLPPDAYYHSRSASATGTLRGQRRLLRAKRRAANRELRMLGAEHRRRLRVLRENTRRMMVQQYHPYAL